eukprot:319679_1
MSKDSWFLLCLIYFLCDNIQGQIILVNQQSQQELLYIDTDNWECDMTINDFYSKIANELNTTSTRFELYYGGNLIERTQGAHDMLSDMEPIPIAIVSDDPTRIELKTQFIETSVWFGGNGGGNRSWSIVDGAITAMRAKSVDYGHNVGLFGIQMNGSNWIDWGLPNRGGNQHIQEMESIKLESGEVVNKVEVYADETYTEGMILFTNMGNTIKVGNTRSRLVGRVSSGTELIGFTINSGWWIDGAKFTWRVDALDPNIEANYAGGQLNDIHHTGGQLNEVVH